MERQKRKGETEAGTQREEGKEMALARWALVPRGPQVSWS